MEPPDGKSQGPRVRWRGLYRAGPARASMLPSAMSPPAAALPPQGGPRGVRRAPAARFPRRARVAFRLDCPLNDRGQVNARGQKNAREEDRVCKRLIRRIGIDRGRGPGDAGARRRRHRRNACSTPPTSRRTGSSCTTTTTIPAIRRSRTSTATTSRTSSSSSSSRSAAARPAAPCAARRNRPRWSTTASCTCPTPGTG